MVKISKQTTKIPKKSNPLADRIEPLGFDDDDPINLSLYGRSGSGKTSLWATFPGPILALICSGKGELRSINTKENRAKIRAVQVESSEDLTNYAEYACDNGFNTIVLDHATGFYDLVLKEILGLDHIPETKSWGLASQQQYGQCNTQFKERVRALLDAPLNTVIVAQEREFNNDSESKILSPTVGSALGPAATGWLNSVSDYICQAFTQDEWKDVQVKMGGKTQTVRKKTGKQEFCLRTGQDSVFMTRFRIPKERNKTLPLYITDPDYDKLIKLIRGE